MLNRASCGGAAELDVVAGATGGLSLREPAEGRSAGISATRMERGSDMGAPGLAASIASESRLEPLFLSPVAPL